ncbi:hypothetical protein Efla_001020 [Eimeria flavescens]
MADEPFRMRVPAHYLPAYVDVRRLKKKLECLVQRAQHQRATVQRRLDILQRPRMLPQSSHYSRLNKQAAAAAADQQDAGTPTATPAAGGPGEAHGAPSPSAALAARADDGMGGSSLRAEAETLSLLPESQFWALLQQQVHELNKFATAKERQIQSDLRLIAARMEQASFSLELPKLRGDEELLIEEQSAEIIHLDLYIRTNHKALLALCSHFDRLLTGAKTTRWFSTSLLKEAYCNVDLERLVLMLSLLWGKYRSKQEGKERGAVPWHPPDLFVRATTKYWIRPENIVRAQCLIVRHLPFLVFGTSDQDLEVSLLGPTASGEGKQLPASALAPTQTVASVYFDNSNAYSYEQRIRRYEGAQLVRFRWYGTNNNGPEEEIFVERKIHHESWSGHDSAKERFVIPQRLVAPYMHLQRDARDLLLEAWNFQPSEAAVKAGESPRGDGSAADWPPEHELSAEAAAAVQAEANQFIEDNKKLKKSVLLGEEIQEEIAEHNLQPMLRTSYLRGAFQLATSNAVRISLDTNLCMVNEYRPGRQDEPFPNWCRLADELLGKDEVVRFPYAILEVKLHRQPAPPWVHSMLLLTDATLVYKFSKFQHGMAFLHREKIGSGMLPHWLLRSGPPQQQGKESGPRRPPGGVFQLGASVFDSIRSSADNLFTPLARSFGPANQQGGRKRRSLMSTGESEDVAQTEAHRTFLWLQAEQELQMQQAPPPLCMDGKRQRKREEGGGEGSHTSSADSLRERLARRHIRTVRKIDPKTSFAGERTFLHYIQKGLYLAGASIACLESLGGGWGLVLAFVLAGACVLLCCGAYAIYVNRCRRISQRVAKAGAANLHQVIDSQWGPVLAFGTAGLATVLVLLLQTDINLKGVLRHEQAQNAALYEELQRRPPLQTQPNSPADL